VPIEVHLVPLGALISRAARDGRLKALAALHGKYS
jgi:hypothetical protein